MKRHFVIATRSIKDFEFGWGWDNHNILYHCNTIFPNATPDMLKFWFINHGNGRGKYHWYKWWHPCDMFVHGGVMTNTSM